MAVRQEIKSHLAKLLATEDIVVEHKKVEQASFNPWSRVLILPLWEKASNDVYDMMVGHEVGHALFTPDDEWWNERKISKQCVNVVEDARIEKLMKRKYMGIAKNFYKGYNELHEQDYFEINGRDLSTYGFVDRVNLYFKIGSQLDLVFSTAEKQIITLIQNAETFDDTLSAAEALHTFCQQKKEETLQNQQQAKLDFEKDLEDSGDNDGNISTDSEPTVPDIDSSAPLEDRSSPINSTSGVDDFDPIVETVRALEDNIQKLIDHGGDENVYIEIPEVNLDSIIVPNQQVHEVIDENWEYQQNEWIKRVGYFPNTIFSEVDSDYSQFKRDAQREVSYLVKEFECRKSASAYARSSTDRTGVLDTTKLQTYRFNEDIFKRVTVLPDGKNHGLVFILDWSGSMSRILSDTIKQLYNLIWFCRKVQIPFEVYAFTSDWSHPDRYDLKSHYKKKDGIFKVEEEFNLMNLFSSKVNAKTLEHQMINIWRIAQCFRVSTTYTYPERLVLSGTPLNEAFVSLHQILPKFQKENELEKVQCIILSDGEANPLPYHITVQRTWESEPYLGCRNVNPNKCLLRDRKLGKTYKFGFHWHQFADIMLENLKDRFPFTNFIGIRVLIPRDAKSFIRMYGNDRVVQKDWKKTRSFNIKNSGYDAYFGMSSTALAQDTEFEVDEDATKVQIKNAFIKSLKTKKLNKKVLGEFIELVA